MNKNGIDNVIKNRIFERRVIEELDFNKISIKGLRTIHISVGEGDVFLCFERVNE